MRACSNLGQLDRRVSDAVKTRQEVDLRIGKSEREIGGEKGERGRGGERELEGGRGRGRERERERCDESDVSL